MCLRLCMFNIPQDKINKINFIWIWIHSILKFAIITLVCRQNNYIVWSWDRLLSLLRHHFVAVLLNSNICLICTTYVHLHFEHYFLRNKKKRVSKYITWRTYVREFIEYAQLACHTKPEFERNARHNKRMISLASKQTSNNLLHYA